MSANVDFLASAGYFAGEDKTIFFTIKDESAVLMNITGWTIRFKLSQTLSGNALFTINGVIVDAPNGVVKIDVPAANTEALTPGDYYYVVRRTDSGSAAELAYGKMTLLDPYVNYSP
jgi:hypothetical protein